MGLTLATGWELAIQLAKLLEYLGIASLAGGTVCLLFYRDERRHTIVLITAYIGLCCLPWIQWRAVQLPVPGRNDER